LDEGGVRNDAESILMALVEYYRTASHADRREVRETFARFHAFAWATGVPLEPQTEAGFVAHLLHFSILDQGSDPRDAKLALESLLERARAAGIDVGPPLKEVASLSSDEDRHTWGSTRDWLLRASLIENERI
jgi:hypothetical protein